MSADHGTGLSSTPDSYQWQQTTVLSPEAERLLALQIRVRWGIVSLIWLVLGVPSLWMLRADIRRLLEFFTWAGVKYPLLYEPKIGFCLCVCVATTLTTLMWQCKFEWLGPSASERHELEKLAASIRKRGSEHFLWSWVNHRG